MKHWLSNLGLEQYEQRFDEQAVSRELLQDLTEADFDELDVESRHRETLRSAAAHPGHAQAGASDSEPRLVTVMFCDLVGSTALSTKIDVEDLREVIHTFHATCEKVIRHHGGTIARYMGDATLTYFGYPESGDDDAARAVAAGLALVEGTRALELAHDLNLQNRVGIATGFVLVGELTGSDEARQREIVGETPVLASKLEPLAKPFQVVVSDQTREQAGARFEYADLGTHEAKGVSAPFQAWIVLSERTPQTRLEVVSRECGLELPVQQLLALKEQDLRDMGLLVGHRKLILRAISALQLADQLGNRAQNPVSEAAAATASELDAERRQLTVMFCNLLGSDKAGTALDDAGKRHAIRAFHDICNDIVTRYDGMVARYNAEGVLAYFGYPRAHEDDAERAARAGIDIVEAVNRLELADGVTLQSRVGIDTGLVVVGDLIGSGESQEREVLGETPNRAARLQALAEPDHVVVGPSTHRLIGVMFKYEDLGRHTLKGFDEPVQAWQVVEEVSAESRFEALRWEGGLSPLVGRDDEIAKLGESWRQSRLGKGQAVLISGEPGIGKSRVIEGLVEHIGDAKLLRLRFQCSTHYASSALYPFITQLERAAHFERGDTDLQKLDKLVLLLERSAEDLQQSVALFAPLLSIPLDDRYPALELTPQRRRERTLEALLAQVETLARDQPVLVLFEDTQWIDPTSFEVLGIHIERLATHRIMTIITHRPEFECDWGRHGHVTTMPLGRLGREQGVAITERLSGGKALPPELLEHILNKTDGVPLYVEELTKTILESDLLIDAGDHFVLEGPLESLAIPATLQDSLIARFDRLGPAKQVVQVGATIGRDFPHELIEAVSPIPPHELDGALTQLIDAELLSRHGQPPEANYTFRHALVQDTAYSTLLRRRKRGLHAQIAEALENQFPSTVETRPEMLAHHYTEAKVADQAVGWWYKAGQLAAQRSANLEAINHLNRGLGVVPELGDPIARHDHELNMQIALGQAYFAIKGFGAAEVQKAYTRARELCQGEVDTRSVLRVIVGLWNFHMVRGDLHTAIDLAEQRMTLSKQADDPLVLPGAQQNVGAIRFHFGDFSAAREHMLEGIALYDQLSDKAQVFGSFDPRMGCLCYEAWALWMLGYPDQAMQRGLEMMAIAKRLAHPVSVVFAQLFLSCVQQFRREPAAVEAQTETMLALSAENDFEYRTAQGGMLHGWSVVLQGRHQAGLVEIQESLAAWRDTGAQVMGPHYLALLADASRCAGQWGVGLDAVQQALALTEKNDERYYEAELHRLHGELLLGQAGADAAVDIGTPHRGSVAIAPPPVHTEVENAFQRALKVARSQHARSFELRAAVSLAGLWQQSERRTHAHELLAGIYDGFTEGNETADLREAAALLEILQ